MKTDNNDGILDLPRLMENCLTVTRRHQYSKISRERLKTIVSQHVQHPAKIISVEQLSSRFKEQLDAYWKQVIESYRETLD